MDYIRSMFKINAKNKPDFSVPLKAASGRNSAHSLPFDILEEIFLFVPYQYCQNIWIASSILQIPLAPKLKRLRAYQEWLQVQIDQLKADSISQKTRIDKLIADNISQRTEINKQRTEITELKEKARKEVDKKDKLIVKECMW
ncbi:hypothetical protein Ddc_22123 [Ditylenchus destructor]|nr:hypothetical protein Ddc_22123 [Ditylenchus destructor]